MKSDASIQQARDALTGFFSAQIGLRKGNDPKTWEAARKGNDLIDALILAVQQSHASIEQAKTRIYACNTWEPVDLVPTKCKHCGFHISQHGYTGPRT